jgi:hypothetical protein
MRASILALAFGLSTAFAVPAMAHDYEKRFPMPAAEFQQHVDAREARARARMEDEIAERKLTDDEANQLRARFDAVIATVNVEVQKAEADGTVTLEEAKAVHALAFALWPHHHHHHDNG